eukprot:SAG31_NODE_866_length_11370_cov_4.806761_13_plen_72_part_00
MKGSAQDFIAAAANANATAVDLERSDIVEKAEDAEIVVNNMIAEGFEYQEAVDVKDVTRSNMPKYKFVALT